ncbi:hypothetical protein J25TS5_15560 [Paenibacillus faecis]|nr:hypothetical protein J25TS5_15560 [Paenibacillus faecis]
MGGDPAPKGNRAVASKQRLCGTGVGRPGTGGSGGRSGAQVLRAAKKEPVQKF